LLLPLAHAYFLTLLAIALCCAAYNEAQAARGKRKKDTADTATDAKKWTIVKRLKAVGNFLFAKFK
jgi:hypothetical protein